MKVSDLEPLFQSPDKKRNEEGHSRTKNKQAIYLKAWKLERAQSLQVITGMRVVRGKMMGREIGI